MIRKITEQHLKDASKKPVYKVVRVEEDSSLKSLWVRGTRKEPLMIEAHDMKISAYTLTYKPDRVVSNGRYGIWCCRTLGDAVKQADLNGGRNLCNKIFKAFPIGKPITPPETWGRNGTVLYPAVIMGSSCLKTLYRRR